MINCVIVYGCADSPKEVNFNKHWIPWVKKELEKKGIKTKTPLMPEPWKPSYEKWKKEFDRISVNEDSVLIGHSCGGAFLVRWLGETKKRISQLILVAPWKIPYRQDGRDKEFYNYEINEGVKDNAGEIVIFTSDDEEEDGKKSAKIFHNALGGKLIELKNRGHYIFGDMKTEEFPELLEEVSV